MACFLISSSQHNMISLVSPLLSSAPTVPMATWHFLCVTSRVCLDPGHILPSSLDHATVYRVSMQPIYDCYLCLVA